MLTTSCVSGWALILATGAVTPCLSGISTNASAQDSHRRMDTPVLIWQFTRRQMRHLVESVGFKILRIRTHRGFCPRTPWKQFLLKWIIDPAVALGYGDGMKIIATRR